jgi:DNA-binding NarL/FixJ family response regulator
MVTTPTRATEAAPAARAGDRPVTGPGPARRGPVRVLVADDQDLVRAGFRLLVEGEGDLAVVGEAADGAQAVALARAARPDVVLMDIRMPRLDGLQATRELAAMAGLEQVRVLILTTYDSDAHVFEALEAGASGFLLKDAGPAELLHAIRVVAAGEALLAPRVTRRLIAHFTAARTTHQRSEERLAVLTDREREVLALVGAGLSNAEIAERLVISKATARTHVSRAIGKLGARDRAQLVVVAYQTGLVSPGHPASV